MSGAPPMYAFTWTRESILCCIAVKCAVNAPVASVALVALMVYRPSKPAGYVLESHESTTARFPTTSASSTKFVTPHLVPTVGSPITGEFAKEPPQVAHCKEFQIQSPTLVGGWSPPAGGVTA